MNRSNSEAEALDQKTKVSNVHEDSWGKAIFYELYMYTMISMSVDSVDANDAWRD